MTPCTKAVDDINMESERQKVKFGFTAEHDDQHPLRYLVRAGIAYALRALGDQTLASGYWPFDTRRWLAMRNDPRRLLVKSGAMIVAAIEWIDRQEAKKKTP